MRATHSTDGCCHQRPAQELRIERPFMGREYVRVATFGQGWGRIDS